ncbi:MAG TPA: glycogen debranching N-terminal domain-containing protein [Chthoniobacterales bacterium]|nr:glycogen debranching N-terminal domain-containing protein [Chthoniobacterales bacterium]
MRRTQLHQLVQLRPRHDVIYVSQNRTVLATELDGTIKGGAERGLFFHQTRLLSRYGYFINDEAPVPLALSNVEQHSWLGYYIALSPNAGEDGEWEILGPGGKLGQQPIELRVARFIGDGMHEDLTLTNFTQQSIALSFEIEIDADFADIAETKLKRRKQKGKMSCQWRRGRSGKPQLVFDYKAQHRYDHQGERGTARLHRGLIIKVDKYTSQPVWKRGCLRFDVQLQPHAEWRASLNFIPVLEGEAATAFFAPSFSLGDNRFDSRRRIFLEESTTFATAESDTLAPIVLDTLERARQDLAALRLYDLDQSKRAWTLAAGLPIYLALFGRDTLTAAWQASLLGPEMMRGTLPVIAGLQGRGTNDWRDEQPGKLIHQADTGPVPRLNFTPLARYYGSITTSGFYPVVVSELWHWTGDKELVQQFVAPALKALRSLDEYADLDRDGFHEYQTRSEKGVRNQGWKDSSDAIVYEDGSQVETPIATCEEQGFVYAAKLHLSELLWWLGRTDQAKQLYHEAEELKKRFNEEFWMEEEKFFALGLDPQKRKIRSIASNPGHCIATAIVDEEFVTPTADRLFAEDMFSGWGVRTLSSRHPAFNPYSYHLGSVWPVEQGTFALGFMRYGLHDHVERICRSQFEAAAIFVARRLPELFSGHQRDSEHPFPAHYPGANSPQAWSASAVFCLLQAMLGLYPYAPLNMLLVDPHLPEWLPQITLQNLRVGDAVVTIRFSRKENGASEYAVLDKRGSLHVLRQPSPWSLTATFAERLKDALTSLLPGK